MKATVCFGEYLEIREGEDVNQILADIRDGVFTFTAPEFIEIRNEKGELLARTDDMSVSSIDMVGRTIRRIGEES